MTTEYTDAPRTRVITPAALNNGVHENHSIGQTVAIAPKKRLFEDLSIPQVIAGAAAAATSVALVSKIGVVGSVIGAALSSVITVVSSQVYRHFISAGAEAIKSTHTSDDYPAGAYAPVDAEGQLGGAANAAGAPTTARIAPDELRAKAAAERGRTQKKVIVFSIAIAVAAVALTAGAILVTTAGEGLGERPETILSSRSDKDSADDDTAQQTNTQNAPAQDSSSQAATGQTTDSSTGGTASSGTSTDQSSTSSSSDSSNSSQTDSSNQGTSTDTGTGATADGSSSNSSSDNSTSGNQSTDSSSNSTGTAN